MCNNNQGGSHNCEEFGVPVRTRLRPRHAACGGGDSSLLVMRSSFEKEGTKKGHKTKLAVAPAEPAR